MKILEINKFNYLKGGAERHFLDVITLLESRDNEVAVFSMDNMQNESSIWKKYFISYVGYNKNDSNLIQKIIGIFRMFYSIEAKKKIAKILDDFGPDVVHLHNIYHQISFSIISEIKKRNIPIVMTVHDYNLISPDKDEFLEKIGKQHWKFLFINKKYSFGKRLLLVLKIYWENFWNWKEEINMFISPSLFVAEKLEKGGIEKEKIVIMPHFIPDSFLEKVKKENSLGDYAFYFGRISKEKGVPEMMEVFKSMRNFKLVLAGEIEDDTKIFVDKNIVYLGKLSKEKITEFIRGSKFCVSFSKLPETFGLIALESIALGKPFISLDAGAYKEIIEQNKTGFICNDIAQAKEKISKIISREIVFNEEEISKIAKNKFGAEIYFKKLMNLFELVRQKDSCKKN